MYTLMNKDRPLIDFEFDYLERIGSYEIMEHTIYERPWFINDLDQWVRKRHAPKHRANIEKLLNLLGLDNVKAMIDFSKGLSLTDTLWVNCDDRYQWDKVNLYDTLLMKLSPVLLLTVGYMGGHSQQLHLKLLPMAPLQNVG